ncbi:alpha/beta fold hydrolase [Microbacterium sp. EST19A]|uniref:alpha/beta fold hydrolase n=1 Tax=Microbacterium sp. EST19A TaxID=2862681 RepID=UPI001CBECE44|nr:alpha/beta fold hydrolase [Microbacterium sp. EST19A]
MKLNTVIVGAGSRTAALVHGASRSSDVWREFAPYLQEHDLRLILVDQRGHGDSPRGDRYRVADFAEDLVDTLPKDLDLLIGQSLGGLTTAWAAEELQPKRLIGIDPALAMAPFHLWLIPFLGPRQKRFPDWMLRALSREQPPEALGRLRAEWAKWDETSLIDIKSSYLERPFPVGAPVVPSTLVLAEKSFAVRPEVAAALAAAGWDVRRMKGGHDLHTENPAGLAEVLRDVLVPEGAQRSAGR